MKSFSLILVFFINILLVLNMKCMGNTAYVYLVLLAFISQECIIFLTCSMWFLVNLSHEHLPTNTLGLYCQHVIQIHKLSCSSNTFLIQHLALLFSRMIQDFQNSKLLEKSKNFIISHISGKETVSLTLC